MWSLLLLPLSVAAEERLLAKKKQFQRTAYAGPNGIFPRNEPSMLRGPFGFPDTPEQICLRLSGTFVPASTDSEWAIEVYNSG